MLLSTILVPLVLATVTIAVPLDARATGSCAGLGSRAFNNIDSFTLAAYNSSAGALNANSTGAPLVLGQAGAISGAEFKVLSTWASFPYNQWPILNMVDGGIIAKTDAADTRPAVGTGPLSSGDEPGFLLTTPVPTAALEYCAVQNKKRRLPILALNGRTDLFTLCPSGNAPFTQWNVFFNYTQTSFGPDQSACYPVKLQIVRN